MRSLAQRHRLLHSGSLLYEEENPFRLTEKDGNRCKDQREELQARPSRFFVRSAFFFLHRELRCRKNGAVSVFRFMPTFLQKKPA